jgi:hypothetical protein
MTRGTGILLCASLCQVAERTEARQELYGGG